VLPLERFLNYQMESSNRAIRKGLFLPNKAVRKRTKQVAAGMCCREVATQFHPAGMRAAPYDGRLEQCRSDAGYFGNESSAPIRVPLERRAVIARSTSQQLLTPLIARPVKSRSGDGQFGGIQNSTT
jgi:hypothetical protein